MFSDYHVHTVFSADSDVPVTLQLQKAIQLGMNEICITDHNDYDVNGGVLDFYLDLPAYLPYMQMIKQEYDCQIRVRIGIELGLQLHIKAYLSNLVETYPFDFIIGSSHFIRDMDPYCGEYYEDRSESEAFEEYFEVTLKRVSELDYFDVLGHLDYIIRYSPNKNKHYSYYDYQDYIDSILKILISRGQGIECNTGGYHYGLGEPNPCKDILLRYRELGGEILTVGSDAHEPDQIGQYFGQARQLLQDCGYRYYTVFHQRKPEFIKID